jgi:8-oxo-dGTP diphosphatase
MKTITVAAAIILNQQQQMLVVRKHHTTCFMQVGGKLEPDELPEDTILREIQEEVGGQAVIQQFVGRFETATANEPDHRLVSYVYYVSLNQEPKIAAEIAEMKWVDLDDRQTLLAPLSTEVVIPWVKQFLTVHALT